MEVGRTVEKVASTKFLEIKVESQRWVTQLFSELDHVLFVLRVNSLGVILHSRQCCLLQLSHELNITCVVFVLFLYFV